VDCSVACAAAAGVQPYGFLPRSPSSRPPHWRPQPRSMDAGSPWHRCACGQRSGEPAGGLGKRLDIGRRQSAATDRPLIDVSRCSQITSPIEQMATRRKARSRNHGIGHLHSLTPNLRREVRRKEEIEQSRGDRIPGIEVVGHHRRIVCGAHLVTIPFRTNGPGSLELAQVGVRVRNPFARSKFFKQISCRERSLGSSSASPASARKAGEAGGEAAKAKRSGSSAASRMCRAPDYGFPPSHCCIGRRRQQSVKRKPVVWGSAHARGGREPLAFRFGCFPPAAPAFVQRRGNRDDPKDRSRQLICFEEIWSGEGSNPRPHLATLK